MARVLHLSLLLLLLVASCAAAPRGARPEDATVGQRQLMSQLQESALWESAQARSEYSWQGRLSVPHTPRCAAGADMGELLRTRAMAGPRCTSTSATQGTTSALTSTLPAYSDGRQIGHVLVDWGGFGMVHAEKKLFHAALQDPANQRFVLVSDSCIPIRSFDFVYSYLNAANKSFITSHDSSWRLGGKKLEAHIPKHLTRKGSQWVALTRPDAELVVKESHYIKIFMEIGARIPDETYVQVSILALLIQALLK